MAALEADPAIALIGARMITRPRGTPVLTDSDRDESAMATRRLRQLVDVRNETASRGYDIRYSVGEVAFDPLKHASIVGLLADADAAMYQH